MKKGDKILVVLHFRDPFSHPRRGIEVFIHNLYKLLVGRIKVYILFPPKTRIVRIMRIPLLNRINPNLFQVYIPVRNGNFWIYIPDIKSYLLGLFFYKRVIIGNHGFLKLDLLTSIIFRIAKFLIRVRSIDYRIHCLNKYQEMFFSKILRFERDRIYLIRNPIFTEAYSEPIVSKKFVVLSIGSCAKQKGCDILIQTIRMARRSEINWIIAGLVDKKFEKEILDLDKKYENVRYLGYVSEDEKKRLFQISSVLVLPSRYEAQPITILEALVSGVPVILSNISVFKEIISIDDNFGVCLDKNSPESLLREIIIYYKKFFKDPMRYYEFRIKIMKKARKTFNTKNFRENFLRMLDD